MKNPDFYLFAICIQISFIQIHVDLFFPMIRRITDCVQLRDIKLCVNENCAI